MRPQWARSLRVRVALGAAAIVGITLLAAGLTITQLYARDQRADLDAALRRQARGLTLPAVLAPPDGIGGRPLVAPLDIDSRVRVQRDGEVVADLGNAAGTPLGAVSSGYDTVTIDGAEWRVFAREAERGGTDVAVQVGRPTASVEASIATVRRTVLGVGGVAVVVAVGLSWAVAGRLVRSLGRLRDAATSVSSTRELHRRVPVEGPTEVEELADSVNTMLARLDTSVAEADAALAASRSFAASVAHELRTPLTSIGANLDFLYGSEGRPDERAAAGDRAEALAEIAAEQARLLDLLDGLRLLAHGDTPAALPLEDVDLGELVDERVQVARRRHPRDVIELDVAAGSLPIHGWRQGLAALVDNLVGNALGHGRRGDRPVTVGVALHPDSRMGLCLVVDDDGPGVPPGEREAAFGRFTRGTTAVGGGSGLGLALVAQQAAIHGGAASICDAPGGGGRVVVGLRGTDPT